MLNTDSCVCVCSHILHIQSCQIDIHVILGLCCVVINSCTGLDSTRFTWDSFIEKSPGKWNALALDQRGWGESPLGNEDEYNAVAVAADIEAALRENFGNEKVVLVGHSMGGKVAMEIAADYPERCVYDNW